MRYQKSKIAVGLLLFLAILLASFTQVQAQGYVYYANPTTADQGATGTRTVKSLVTAIGSTKKATIVLAHSSSGSNTTYTFGTSTTIPSNIALKIEPGALASIATGKTLTINGPFSSGFSYQVFNCDGTGKVMFGPVSVKEIHPDWWATNTNPGTTDMTAAIQAAIDSIIMGTVKFLGTTYAYTGITVTKNGITLSGQGDYATKLYCTAGNSITVGDVSTLIYGFRIEKMMIYNDSTSGHLIYIPNGLCYGYIDAAFTQYDTDKSIIYYNDGAGGVYDSLFTGSNWEITSDATVPAVYIHSPGNMATGLTFFRFRAQSNLANAYFFEVISSGNSSYNYVNTWRDINFEQSNGGGIKIAGGYGFTMESLGFHDITTTTANLIELTNDGISGLNTLHSKISSVFRFGGALGAGLYDISLTNADGIVLDTIQGSGATVNANNNQYILINSPSVTVSNSNTTSKLQFDGLIADRFTGGLPLNHFISDGELTIASGVITATGSRHTVDTEGDAASDDLDTITAGKDGQILIIRPINDGRTVVIKHGTGNIISGTDFTMDSAYDHCVLIYDAAAAKWFTIIKSDLGS